MPLKLLQEIQPTWMLDFIGSAIVQIIKKLDMENLTHGDLHWGNIGFQYLTSQSKTALDQYDVVQDGVIVFQLAPMIIDFGFASDKCSNPELELLQLMRSSSSEYGIRCKENMDYLFNKYLYPLWQQYTGKEIPINIEQAWREKVDNYMESIFR